METKSEIRRRLEQVLQSWNEGPHTAEEERYRNYWLSLSPKLPSHMRDTIESHYIQGHTREEIADRRRVKRKTVNDCISHGMARIVDLIWEEMSPKRLSSEDAEIIKKKIAICLECKYLKPVKGGMLGCKASSCENERVRELERKLNKDDCGIE